MKPDHGQRAILRRVPHGKARRKLWEMMHHHGNPWFGVADIVWDKIKGHLVEKLWSECR